MRTVCEQTVSRTTESGGRLASCGSPRHQARQQHIRVASARAGRSATSRNRTRPRQHPEIPNVPILTEGLKEPFRYGEAFRVFRYDLPRRPPEAEAAEAQAPLAEA
jgi:hypothetical protein